MLKRWQLAALAFVSACKLLHREAATDAGTVTSSSTTIAASDPDLGGTPSAMPSASAIASADVVDAAAVAPSASVDPRIAAREQALREAREFGMLGMIDPDAGSTIGLGNIGTIGTGTVGTSRIGHNSISAPSIRQGALSVNGRLPPEVIKRIIRQNFGRFRLCYENGLRLNPSLQGRVSTKFVIAHDGSVSTTQDGGSDMPDQNVTSCVVRAHGNLSFPQPEGGIVIVTDPLIFNPSS